MKKNEPRCQTSRNGGKREILKTWPLRKRSQSAIAARKSVVLHLLKSGSPAHTDGLMCRINLPDYLLLDEAEQAVSFG